MHRGWKGPSDEGASEGLKAPLCTHLLAAVRRVDSVVQAGSVSQPEDLLKQASGEVLEGRCEDKVANLSVLLVAVMAEVDEVLDVVVGTDVLDVLETKRQREKCLFLCLTQFICFCFISIIRKKDDEDSETFSSSEQKPAEEDFITFMLKPSLFLFYLLFSILIRIHMFLNILNISEIVFYIQYLNVSVI